MNKLKHFLLNSKNINKSSFIWNMAGSMLMAFQSVIMLMIITRTLNLYEAGVFTLAYASANLFLNIGKYGMRNFQVSDVKRQFNFKEYNTSRIITTLLMLIVSLVYVVIAKSKNDYSMNKTWIIIWMCLFKIVDSIEDAYLGYYQQENRLDVAGKMLTLRMILTILVFGLGLIFLRDQLISLMIATIFTTLLLIIFVALTYSAFRKEESVRKGKVWELLRVCFPLFLGCFLAFYIGNAPKYAIDSLLSDEMQACYGFIAMPVFVIGLLNNFIFSPMIARMSMMWKERQNKDFFRLFWIQILIIGIITIVCEAGAFVLGVPVLSILYNTDLAPYKTELLVLLLGGGFLALSGLFVTIMTIIRIQNSQAIGYGIVAVCAYILSPIFVRKYAVMGASVLYLLLMILLCIIFAIMMMIGFKKKRSDA